MITWMLYSVLLSGGLAVAADRIAGFLRARARPERWVWTLALLGSALLPFLLPLMPRLGGSAVGVVSLPGLTVGAEGPETAGGAVLGLDQIILLFWAAAVLVLGLQLWRSTRRLRRIVADGRLIRRWPVEIRSTPGTGPAVAGLRRPVLLLPDGLESLARSERRWIMRHEFEHIRAGDPALIWLALGVRSLMPWNPATWFMGRRLREGLEFDCDRRVLARRPDPRSYGETLLSLTTPGPGPALPAAAFREPLVSLKRRFFSMTTPRRALAPRTLALIAGLAAAGWMAACEFSPTYVTVEATRADVTAESDSVAITDPTRVGDGPTFTPFTVAPSIINRDEAVAALEREYPPSLRDAGIGGQTNVWFFINDEGEVEDLRVQESSGNEQLDQAAIRAAAAFRFTAALNKEQPVPVWVAFPITFQTP